MEIVYQLGLNSKSSLMKAGGFVNVFSAIINLLIIRSNKNGSYVADNKYF